MYLCVYRFEGFDLLMWETNEYDGPFLDFIIQSRQDGLDARIIA